METTIELIKIEGYEYNVLIKADKIQFDPDDWTSGWYPEVYDFEIVDKFDSEGETVTDTVTDYDYSLIQVWIDSNTNKIDNEFQLTES